MVQWFTALSNTNPWLIIVDLRESIDESSQDDITSRPGKHTNVVFYLSYSIETLQKSFYSGRRIYQYNDDDILKFKYIFYSIMREFFSPVIT